MLTVPVGFGKTVVSLTAAKELIADGIISRVLVIAPLRVCQLTWATEYKKWAHLSGLKVSMAIGTPAARERAVLEKSDILVTNYENIPWLFKHHKKNYACDGLIIDELTKLKTPGGAVFKSLRFQLKHFKWRCGMTGTLTEEGLEGLYGQVLMIDNGKTLGRSKEHFLTTYFTPTDWNQYNWEAKPGTMELFAKKLKPFTFGVNAADYEVDLPPLITALHPVTLTDASRKVYKDMVKHMLVETADIDAPITAANAAVMTGKLQQICAGFLYADNDQPTQTIHYDKLDVTCKEITRVVSQGKQVLVVYTFMWELERLNEQYPMAEVLGAGVSSAQAEKINRDWNAGDLKILLVHPKSAGHGLNLQYAPDGGHIIFCGPIWSRDQTDQVIGRIRRRGFAGDAVIVSFTVTVDTVEDRVILPRVHRKGEDAALFKAYLQSLA